ncbi:MFS transporter [Streptomyces mutabilis]|uniref:MFS transporter n=1 Tax=Streptomyces TaxID=1883 RepID=UPI0025B4029A|nr:MULTISPECIES: MFS transporter [unclassified Streptomyces]MDN3248728.1 MFS transporter [Streptomyces sp. ZSW22]MDN3256716.1 MFS transporter [Streptomyces sp. MA25(2023)]MDQ0383583.1 sugar phosphate permease [Streptomyces sp. DSM 42143]
MVVRPLPSRHPRLPETPEPPAYDRRRAWLVLVMVVAFMMINYADKSVLGLAAVPLMDELGIDKSTYGLISSSFYVLFSVSGLVVGLLSARWSTRTMLLVMAALWAVAQLPALAASVPALIAGRLLLGAAEGPAASMSMHTLYAWFPPGRRGMPSALQIGGAALGTAVAAPVLTWFIVNLGWRSAFVALAITSAAWCVVWYAVGKDGPYGGAAGGDAPAAEVREPSGSGGRDAARPAGKTSPVPLPRLLLSGTVVGGVLSAFGSHWALAVSSAWLPVYLQTRLDMAATSASVAISAVSVLSLVLLLTVPALVDRRKRSGRAGRATDGLAQGAAVLVSGAALALLPFTEPRPLQLVLVALAFAAHSVALPLHYVTTAAVVPAARRGAVFGVVAATGTLPGMFVPYLTGRLVDGAASEAAGYSMAFLLSAAVMAVCGAVAMLAIRPERDARALGGEG